MMALLDMGKYNFFVWGSMALFAVMMVVDFISIHRQRKQVERQIEARKRRHEA